MGDFLVDHPRITLIAFTGSMEIGLRIVERARRTGPAQTAVKQVIAEMGGKNAIIIDDDADLDEAVPAVMRSAFGYQGQKCSACSRVIVLDAIYERFLERLLVAARSVRIGPAEDPANFMGPVIDRAAQEKIRAYVEPARQEGRAAFASEVPDSDGFYVPITVDGGAARASAGPGGDLRPGAGGHARAGLRPGARLGEFYPLRPDRGPLQPQPPATSSGAVASSASATSTSTAAPPVRSSAGSPSAASRCPAWAPRPAVRTTCCSSWTPAS